MNKIKELQEENKDFSGSNMELIKLLAQAYILGVKDSLCNITGRISVTPTNKNEAQRQDAFNLAIEQTTKNITKLLTNTTNKEIAYWNAKPLNKESEK